MSKKEWQAIGKQAGWNERGIGKALAPGRQLAQLTAEILEESKVAFKAGQLDGKKLMMIEEVASQAKELSIQIGVIIAND